MRYQYQSQGFKNDFYGLKNNFNLSPVSLIIIINIFIYLITNNQWSVHQIFGISRTNIFRSVFPLNLVFCYVLGSG